MLSSLTGTLPLFINSIATSFLLAAVSFFTLFKKVDPNPEKGLADYEGWRRTAEKSLEPKELEKLENSPMGLTMPAHMRVLKACAKVNMMMVANESVLDAASALTGVAIAQAGAGAVAAAGAAAATALHSSQSKAKGYESAI